MLVQFAAVGDAPSLKKKKFMVGNEKKMTYILEFLRRNLKIRPDQSLVRFQEHNL